VRDVLSMTGTNFGCGTGLCGACTIHIDGPADSVVPRGSIRGRGQARCHHRARTPTPRAAATCLSALIARTSATQP
jgi:isoquinoline 1-oxidoreductase alpha subunit